MDQDKLHKRMAELESELSQLRGQLETLTHQVEQRRAGSDHSMRATLRCPSCNGRSILHAKWLQDRTDSGAVPLSIDKQGLFIPKPVAPFECHICTKCGLVEWHVRNVDDLDLQDDRFELLEVDDPNTGPYR